MPQPRVTEQERNLATFRVLIDRGFSAGDISAVDATCAAGCVEHQDGFTDMESVKGGISFLHLLALISRSASRTWSPPEIASGRGFVLGARTPGRCSAGLPAAPSTST